ncbi:MAG: VRR-NUC domain-containing protein [Dehalococcoidales bacterium]|nr:VRR-NUC domain-containing protein [Dehalococcoidales bacterium]
MNLSQSELAARQTEAEFESAVVQFAQLHHWKVAGFRPARVTKDGKETYRTAWKYSGMGFPDLVCVRPQDHRPGRILFIELKSEKGKLSQEQEWWARAITAANGEWYSWKPSMWPQIESVLK